MRGHYLGVRAEVAGKLHDGVRVRWTRWQHFRSGSYDLVDGLFEKKEPESNSVRRVCGCARRSFQNRIRRRSDHNRHRSCVTRGISAHPQRHYLAWAVSHCRSRLTRAGFLPVRHSCRLVDARPRQPSFLWSRSLAAHVL